MSSTADDIASAQAAMCGWLIGKITDFPREEFGDSHRLAVDAAYRRVTAFLTQELLTVASGEVRL